MPTGSATLWPSNAKAPQPAPAADPTLAFAERFADPSLWEIIEGVPIFDAHVEIDDESGETLKFGPAELQELVANTNRMVALGKPPGLILGHTDDDLPEEKQPIPIGFAKNLRVQRFGPEQKLGIVQDEWYLPGKKAVAETYPFRSVERWRKGRYFSPIALLRREPRRPLGVVGYRQIGGDAVARYSMRYSAMDEPTPPAAPPPESQAPPPEQMEPSDKDRQLFAKLVEGHEHLGPICRNAHHIAGMVKKYAQEVGEPADNVEHPAASSTEGEFQSEGGPAKNAMTTPTGSNTFIDAEKEPVSPAAHNALSGPKSAAAMWAQVDNVKTRNDDGSYSGMDGKWGHKSGAGKSKNAAPADVARYQALEREVASLKRESRMARYSKVFSDLRTREGIQFDEAEELVEVQDMDQPAFERHVKKMRTNYRKLPIDDQPIRLGELPSPARDNGRVNDKATMDKILKYQQQTPGVSWEKARDHVIKGG